MSAHKLLSLAAAVTLVFPGTWTPARATDRDRLPACLVDQRFPIFAGGGTPVSNGWFFPGTAVYDGESFQGAPYRIPRGCNLRFINLDSGPLTNCHQIMSFKRRKGRPLFSSPLVCGPDMAGVKIRHLKPGVYPFYCSTHFTMYGQIEVVD